MASGYTVSGLSAYVKENEDILIKSLVLGDVFGDTIPNLTKQLGIKTKERLNYLNVDPVLQDGSNCGFNASGSTNFTERDLTTAQFKAQDQFCDRVILGKYYEHLVKIAANKDMADMPFEKEIMDEVLAKINGKMEKMIWQGATSGTVSGGTDLIDGFITLAENTDSASTVSVSIASGTSTYAAIKAVIMAIPEELLDKAVVFVSPAIYRAFVQELVEKNYFHYESGEIEAKDLVFPGTNIRVHKTIGLSGDKRHIYASAYENMVYGADLMNDSETVRAWYDDDNELFKYNIRWNAGVMTYFPDEVVLGTAAADLV